MLFLQPKSCNQLKKNRNFALFGTEMNLFELNRLQNTCKKIRDYGNIKILPITRDKRWNF